MKLATLTLTCRESIPVHHFALDFPTGGSAPCRNRSTRCGSRESRKVVRPIGVTVRLIWTAPLEFADEPIPLSWVKAWRVQLTHGGEEYGKLEQVSAGDLDACGWMGMPKVFDGLTLKFATEVHAYLSMNSRK